MANKISGSNILKKTVRVNDSTPTTMIEPTASYYDLLVGHGTDDKWMNNANFANGVIYKIELKDNIRLDKWTWNTNAGYINSEKASNYLKVSSNNPEASSGSVPQDSAHGKTEFHGSTQDTIYVRFLTEGMRYGVFTAYDKAGNKIEIKIAAHLDRTASPVPSSLVANVSNTTYKFSTWTNRYVRVETASGQNRDNLTQGVTLSGFWQFYYDARNHKGNSVGTPDYSTNSSGIGRYDFKGSAKEVDGKNKISFRGCDRAGNCSNYGAYEEVWIDITVPVCDVYRTLHGSESSYKWLGIGESATVIADCSDPTSTLASGCTVPSLSHHYNYQINTHTAGAQGNNKPGSFTDYAGNSVDCVANQRIQIDYKNPTCETTGGSHSWTNGNRTVTGTCSDTGGSGCVGNISHTYTSNIATGSAGPAGNNNPGRVYDKADNSVECSASRPVYIDKTPPHVVFDPGKGSSHYSNSGIYATATCVDTGGSGLSSRFETTFSSSFGSPNGGRSGIGKCCEDNAGNLICDDAMFNIYHQCAHKVCGVEHYYSCRTSGCGVESYNYCATSGCGTYSCSCRTVCTAYDCEWCRMGRCGLQTQSSCSGIPGLISSKCSSSTQKCSTCNKSCNHKNCGVNKYNYCEDAACGIKSYKTCWHLSH